MSTTPFLPVPVFRAFDSANLPLAGGLLYTYAAGTSTPLATYSDAAGVVPNANPVVLDSTGTATVRLGASAYKFVLKDSGGTTQWTADNYVPLSDSPVFSGNLTVAGTGSFGGTLTTAAINTTGNVAITGNETISGTLTVGGNLIPTVTTGSFAPTWTGFSVAPSGNWFWIKIVTASGSIVYLSAGSASASAGTSNATSMTITNIPAGLYPGTSATARQPLPLIDNSVGGMGAFGFTAGTTLTFFFGSPLSTTGFTNANNKGVGSFACLSWTI